MITKNIAIIGAGVMGTAIATQLVRSGQIKAGNLRIADISQERAENLASELGATAAETSVQAVLESEVVLLCVKPHDQEGVLRAILAKRALWPRALIISIAAGMRIEQIEATVESRNPVIRAMPNTACRIGEGMTVISCGTHVEDEDAELATAIFATLGECIQLPEKYIDVVTSLSASAPAFMYLIMDALADGGVMCGMPRATATELVARMTKGAASMLLHTGKHPSQLKDEVTTPGGCTIAGLLTLEDGNIRSVLARAIETTTQVATKLGAAKA